MNSVLLSHGPYNYGVQPTACAVGKQVKNSKELAPAAADAGRYAGKEAWLGFPSSIVPGMCYVLLILLTTLSCLGDAGPVVDSAVNEFHELLDGERYTEVLATSHEDFRNATSEAEFTRLLEAVHGKLGRVKGTSRSGWRVFYAVGATTVTVVYDTEFEQGKATEQFVYRVKGDAAQLVSYNITSNDLITK